MLSDVEMWREFGKGIIIYPFKPNNEAEEKIGGVFSSNIDSASIYVTASEVGWYYSKNGKENAGKRIPLVNESGKKQLIIPPNEWVILCSEEVIYLNHKFSGTCYAKVYVALKGLGHTAGPIKPNSGSRLLLMFYNHTTQNFAINVGSQIAVVTFHRLEINPSLKDESNKNKGALMKNLGYDFSDLDNKVVNENSYLCPLPREKAAEKMKEDIKDYKKNIKANKNKYQYTYTGKHIQINVPVLSLVLIAVASVVMLVLSFQPLLSNNADWMKYIGSVLLGGVIMGIISVIFNGIKFNIGDK